MSDWQVVEEALHTLYVEARPEFVHSVATWEEGKDALARLREREQTLEDNRTTWMYRAEAAEARVAELEARWQEQEHPFDKQEFDLMATRVARLEEALREIAEACETWHAPTWAGIARRALAHEEEEKP